MERNKFSYKKHPPKKKKKKKKKNLYFLSDILYTFLNISIYEQD